MERPASSSQTVDLEKLAGALNACGIGADVYRNHNGHEEWLEWESPEGWGGKSEHPALAFAMLDVLERAGWNQVTLFPQYGAWRCVMIGEAPSLAEYGPTRTAAIANCLIAAHDAGLVPQSPQESKDGEGK